MFIDKDGNIYQGDMQIGDREATKKEIQAFQNKQELANKLIEAKAYLVKTNHKFFIGYIPKENEDLKAIQAKRDEALLFIRDNS